MQDSNIASYNKRVMAYVIDDIAISLIVIIMLFQGIEEGASLEQFVLFLNHYFLEIITIKFLYQTLFIWYYGATVGKIVTKTIVLDSDYSRLSLGRSALRSINRLISEMLYFIGFFVAFFTKKRQTLHDLIANTVVVDIVNDVNSVDA
jgi:uncharacterized RDD family membrane protein YckC